MDFSKIAEALVRLGSLSPSGQAFVIQLGSIVVVVVALIVVFRALTRRVR